MKLAELAERIGGEFTGDDELEITGIAGLTEAESGDLSFLANSKYAAALAATRASAVIVSRDWAGDSPCAVIRVQAPDRAMALTAELIGTLPKAEVAVGIHPSCVVHPETGIDPTARIGPLCVVERGAVIRAGTLLVAGCYVGREAVIGRDCVLQAHAVVRERVILGDRVILHEGAVVGGDGFGNYRENGAWKKIPHIGTVEIGDDSEIGVNSAVDRARFGKTVVGKGVKVDNLVMIAHNCRIGDHTAMAAQVGISGSTNIGTGVLLAGQAGLAGHLTVGDGAVVGAQAGVTKNVPQATYVTGYPAMPHRKAAESHANLMRLETWKKRVTLLEAKLAALEERLAADERICD